MNNGRCGVDCKQWAKASHPRTEARGSAIERAPAGMASRPSTNFSTVGGRNDG